MKKTKPVFRPTNDSERSPAVHYANWKETIFLRKKLATLNRTERGLVHRITVDQKVIFRRFQGKLHRTKITQARAYGDKERLKDLSGQSMRKLHCESHVCNHSDNNFLDKLEKNPCTYDNEGERKLAESKKKKQALKNVTDDEMATLLEAIMKDQPIEHTPQNLRRLSAIGQMLRLVTTAEDETSPEVVKDINIYNDNSSTKLLKRRPITTDSSHQHNQLIHQAIEKISIGSKSLTDVTAGNIHQDNDIVTDGIPTKQLPVKGKIVQNYRSINLSENHDGKPSEDGGNKTISLTSENGGLKRSNSPLEPQTASNPFEMAKSHSAHRILDKLSRDKSKPGVDNLNQSFIKSLPNKSTSIFEEVKRPDFRGMRLEQAKKVNHTDQVKEFVDGLATFGQGVPDFDYYASKMQADAALQVKRGLPVQLPATPEESYRKHTGDQTISCITLPKVKMRKADECVPQDSDDIFILPVYDLYTRGASTSCSTVSDDEDL